MKSHSAQNNNSLDNAVIYWVHGFAENGYI